MAPVDRTGLRVEVVYCAAPHACDAVALELRAGATVSDALQNSGLATRHALDPATLTVGIWGRAATADKVLRDRDRVEVYRPLQVDPKEARRQRYRGQRKKAPR